MGTAAIGFLSAATGIAFSAALDWHAPISWKVRTVLVGCVVATIPPGLALSPAATSTKCDMLSEALNELAMRCISNDCARVDAVYRTLARSNKGQGLGFKVFGQVLDRSKLRRFALGVYAFLVTVVPLLVAATHNHPALAPMESVEAGTCELTRGQRDLLRATFAQLNATCSGPNVTVADLLL